MQRTNLNLFSPFAFNPVNSRPSTGTPAGVVNRMLSIGLPPWAAWCTKMNRHAYYRMSGVNTQSFIPTLANKTDIIWMNERVRTRVRTSRNYRYVYKQHQYPYVRTGIHHSDALDHWVQLPMVQAAMYAVEKEGGIDNFITSRSGMELRSRYGERLRRHILVRQKEIKKNFVLDQHGRALANVAVEELKKAKTKQQALRVFRKYGMNPEIVFDRLATRLHRQQSKPAPTA